MYKVIRIKWKRDIRYLPLTPESWELYVNIHYSFWKKLGKLPNLVKCRDFNEKTQWLKLFDQSEEIVRYSDKILFRDYVREKIGGQYLIKLYQVQNHFSEINFDTLPNKFVIKANNDSGSVILIRDKYKINYREIEKKIRDALIKPYGWHLGEWPYSYIKPRILIEEFLSTDGQNPPPDYKFHCVNGKVKFLQYIYDRGNDPKEQLLDKNANTIPIHLYKGFKQGNKFQKPRVWSQLINVVEKIADGFKYVRVDLYVINESIYLGEMTFYSYSGHYRGRGQAKLGAYLDFDRDSFKPFLLTELERKNSRFTLYPQVSQS